MKNVCRFLFVFSLVLFFTISCSSATEYRASKYDDLYLEEAYSSLEIEDGASIDELRELLSIRIEEPMIGSAMLENRLYILTETGIHSIDSQGIHMYYSATNYIPPNEQVLRGLFVKDNELWALAYDWQEAFESYVQKRLPENLNYTYGRIEFDKSSVNYIPEVKLNLDLYKTTDRLGLVAGQQNLLSCIGKEIYCIDYIGSTNQYDNANVISLISYNLNDGVGTEICILPGIYNLAEYKENQIISLHANGWAYLGGYTNSAPINMDYAPLVVTDLTTGEQVIVDLFDPGKRDLYYNTCGAPSGFAYDSKQDFLYYTWNGKLHKRKGLDNEQDVVIADAPSSWLKMNYYTDRGYLTNDGFYFGIAPDYGVDIIPIV